MANNGGTVITDKTKLMVNTFTGTAAEVQTAFRAAIANNDVVITCSVSRKKDTNDLTLSVVWYDVA
jgi:molybdenum-dependent DNA-binding transcriptional regulator ModE